MNKLRYGVFALVGLCAASPLQAADVAVTPAQRVEQAWSWTGFYIGGHGGYGWGKDNFSTSSVPPAAGPTLTGLDMRGYVAGGHAGYNWQRGILLGGLEVDASFTDIKGVSRIASIDPLLGLSTASRALKFDYLASLRARLGVVPVEHVLLYATGGLAWTRMTSDVSGASVTGPFSSAFTSSTVGSLLGLVLGGGVESSLGFWGLKNVLVRVEYLHYDFGKQGSNSSSFGGFTSTNQLGPIRADIVRAGVSFLF